MRKASCTRLHTVNTIYDSIKRNVKSSKPKHSLYRDRYICGLYRTIIRTKKMLNFRVILRRKSGMIMERHFRELQRIFYLLNYTEG